MTWSWRHLSVFDRRHGRRLRRSAPGSLPTGQPLTTSSGLLGYLFTCSVALAQHPRRARPLEGAPPRWPPIQINKSCHDYSDQDKTSPSRPNRHADDDAGERLGDLANWANWGQLHRFFVKLITHLKSDLKSDTYIKRVDIVAM